MKVRGLKKGEMLASLTIGEKARIQRFSSSKLEIEMLKMGVVTGDEFTLSNKAPLGGPMAIEVNGTKISLIKPHVKSENEEIRWSAIKMLGDIGHFSNLGMFLKVLE